VTTWVIIPFACNRFEAWTAANIRRQSIEAQYVVALNRGAKWTNQIVANLHLIDTPPGKFSAVNDAMAYVLRVGVGGRIVLWDQDDWYGPDSVADREDALDETKADVVGDAVRRCQLTDGRRFEFDPPAATPDTAWGSSLAWWSSSWEPATDGRSRLYDEQNWLADMARQGKRFAPYRCGDVYVRHERHRHINVCPDELMLLRYAEYSPRQVTDQEAELEPLQWPDHSVLA
jgi:hypothetical protein